MDFCVLEHRHFISPVPVQTTRVCRDFEIDLELGNRRQYICNGERFKVRRGDIMIRRPGDICETNGIQNTHILTLDFACHIAPENYSRNLPGPMHPPFQHELIDRLPKIVHPEQEEVFLRIYTRLLRLSNRNSPAAKALVSELLYRLNAEVYRHQYEVVRPPKSVCNTVMEYMRDNLQENITLDKLAGLVHLEKSYLTRLFRKTVGQTPINLLIEWRLEKAMDLVTNTDMKIGDIAKACGYNTTSFFIAAYKKTHGQTPDAHRKMATSTTE